MMLFLVGGGNFLGTRGFGVATDDIVSFFGFELGDCLFILAIVNLELIGGDGRLLAFFRSTSTFLFLVFNDLSVCQAMSLPFFSEGFCMLTGIIALTESFDR